MKKWMFLSYVTGLMLVGMTDSHAQLMPPSGSNAVTTVTELIAGTTGTNLTQAITRAAQRALINTPRKRTSYTRFTNPLNGKTFSSLYPREEVPELQELLDRAWSKCITAYRSVETSIDAKRYARDTDVFLTLLEGLQRGIPREDLELQVAQIRVGDLSDRAMQLALELPLPTRTPGEANRPNSVYLPEEEVTSPSVRVPTGRVTPGILTPVDNISPSTISPKRLQQMIADFKRAREEGPISVSKFRETYGYWDIPSLTVSRELRAAGIITEHLQTDPAKRVLVVADFRAAKLADPFITAKQFYRNSPQHHDISYETLVRYLKSFNQSWTRYKNPYDSFQREVIRDFVRQRMRRPELSVLDFWHNSPYEFIPFEKVQDWLVPWENGIDGSSLIIPLTE